MSDVMFRAATPRDLEQVHQLNYSTFVEEIPQHAPNPERRLVDRLLDHSTTYVGVEAGEVVAMVAVSGERPFSIDRKLGNVDALVPAFESPCEIRLLAIRPDKRGGRLFAGLARCLYDHCCERGHDIGFISAAASQARLYRHIGFTPFGPRIGTDAAPYQGMYLTWESISDIIHQVAGPGQVNLLPGPVNISEEVRHAFEQPPVSHRGPAFHRQFAGLKARLAELAGARHCQVLLGSGTLANDAVAAQLARSGRPVVVAVNGEFGERLVDHARRAALPFRAVASPWGASLAWDALAAALAEAPRPAWLWAPHCETSTGVLNDLERLKALAADHGAGLCLDAISSFGAAHLDCRGVAFATATSGKAVAAYPGVALVFHDAPIAADPRLPRYLDLGLYDIAEGTPFTHSSNLIAALDVASTRFANEGVAARVASRQRLHDLLRPRLEAAGCRMLAPPAISAPAVLSFEPPRGVAAGALGAWLEERGFALSHRSGYLERRNLIQVCLLGAVHRSAIAALATAIDDRLGVARPAPTAARASSP